MFPSLENGFPCMEAQEPFLLEPCVYIIHTLFEFNNPDCDYGVLNIGNYYFFQGKLKMMLHIKPNTQELPASHVTEWK